MTEARDPATGRFLVGNDAANKYDPSYCDDVIQCGRAGKSKAQIAAILDVDYDTLDNWAEKYPPFSAALTRAKVLAQAWWEDLGQDMAQSPAANTNAAVWKKTMEARFREDYTERKELTGPGGGPISTITKEMTAKEAAEAYAATLASESER